MAGITAGNVKTEDTPQLIEILDEDSPAFGSHEPVQPLDDDNRKRWIAPGAAAALVGLIIYGVISSASDNAPPVAAPVTTGTTVHRSTTTVPPPTTVPERVPYYAAEPPREYKVVSADSQSVTPSWDSNGFQLWAKPGAAGTNGAWFSLQYYYGPMGESIATEAYRVDTGNGHALVSITAPGRLGVQVGDANGTLDIQSLGWSSQDLLALAQSVTVDAGVPSFPPSPLTDGYEMVSSIDPWMALEGFPTEQVFYATPEDPTSSINLFVSPMPDLDRAQLAAARQVGVRALLDHATSFTVNGTAAVAGQLIGGQYALVTWIVDDHIVSMSARMPVSQLIEIARSVHTVSDSEWRGMQFQATHNTSEMNAANGSRSVSNSAPVWTQTSPTGETLTINVSVESNGGFRQIDWFWGLNSGGYSTPATDVAQINTFVDSKRTFVLADLPRTWGTVATLTVTRDGAPQVNLPFVDSDPTLDRTFAAFAFTEDGPYTAQIVAPDGSVLVSWPSS